MTDVAMENADSFRSENLTATFSTMILTMRCTSLPLAAFSRGSRVCDKRQLSTSWKASSSMSFPPASDSSEQPASRDDETTAAPPYTLCFVRHGQSTWNRENRFIGWTDTPLTETGVLEARVAGRMLRQSGLQFDECHTSLLRRSIRTANLILMEIAQEYIPMHKTFRLNERHYGDLVGRHKKEAVVAHGVDQVKRWRRSFDERPPAMHANHPHHPANDPRYKHMLSDIPNAESLKDTVARSSVYWNDTLAPQLQQGRTLLVVGHENNLRSLIMQLENISPQDILHLNLPRAVPLVYKLDRDLQPMGQATDDQATGLSLRGEWLGGDDAVQQILERDHRNVYDTSFSKNLETCEESQQRSKDQWLGWMESVVGQPAASIGMIRGDSPTISGRSSHYTGSTSSNSRIDLNGFDASRMREDKGMRKAA
ncbi:hypothetical protein MPSEU_000818000 [Mayamaea pseudoterrestris]|nr:hypothetical protein MPSEU_000818000 [Mayamaea pseudoterrestris]